MVEVVLGLRVDDERDSDHPSNAHCVQRHAELPGLVEPLRGVPGVIRQLREYEHQRPEQAYDRVEEGGVEAAVAVGGDRVARLYHSLGGPAGSERLVDRQAGRHDSDRKRPVPHQ
eukprot:CAMPEP_0185279712 /NCGR_PEP_ID=MMETSP1359-20130426/64197_1 /TAXON_ID=552665 /ORGANISM="Bigelowiella longifila, Strain CCMP242" /LENGTH=114 /DNA_ID=CAMNT_0027874661 /DNA_START=429 /DNA_END=770 /DNA_ORIENTATION=-